MNIKSESKEIGSNFELEKIDTTINNIEEKITWLETDGDSTFTFSGRAAIELVIKDIIKYRNARVVYMPSYSCSSMIQPFISHNIEVKYYEIKYDTEKGVIYDIDYDMECDIFFFISYFGIDSTDYDYIIKRFYEKGCFIIEDITHSLLSEVKKLNNIDYSIASLRKWFPIPTGGYVIKHNGKLNDKPYINSDKIVTNKIEAMLNKHAYLNGDKISKERFLEKFSEFENTLKEIDSRYKIDNVSYNKIQSLEIDRIRSKRRKNGQIIYEGLKRLEKITVLISKPDFNKGCPLFIPIMISSNKRDKLRQYLINNKVYCPVHWPTKCTEKNKIPEKQLSIICDQRYSERDMKYILALIHEWYKSNF